MRTKDTDFLINIINQTKIINNYTLFALFEGGTKATIEKVLKEIQYPQNDLISEATELHLMCSPEDFVSMLKRDANTRKSESSH